MAGKFKIQSPAATEMAPHQGTKKPGLSGIGLGGKKKASGKKMCGK